VSTLSGGGSSDFATSLVVGLFFPSGKASFKNATAPSLDDPNNAPNNAPDVVSDILVSDIVSGIVSDIVSDTLSDIVSDIVSDIEGRDDFRRNVSDARFRLSEF